MYLKVMKEQILEIAEKLRLKLIAEYEAKNLLLELFGVSVHCEHPYNSIMKGNDIRPTQCLKCGKALSEH
jgi:hypothetical protein